MRGHFLRTVPHLPHSNKPARRGHRHFLLDIEVTSVNRFHCISNTGEMYGIRDFCVPINDTRYNTIVLDVAQCIEIFYYSDIN